MILSLLFFLLPPRLWGQAYPYRMPDCRCPCPGRDTVIGVIRQYQVKEKDTLLDIARRFDLGFNEMRLLYPELDPWLPPEGMVLQIPTRWVLPEFRGEGIVINVPELRLYLFLPKINLVKTHPVGIGVEENPTPLGTFKVVEKKVNPTWHIPPSLQGEYGGRRAIPPGPDNPLGRYWIGLSAESYGIHGTNSPWGIGRLVSHGCIRLYPEDIEGLFPLVKRGMTVKLTYEPVKFGCERGRIFVEVHPDIYGKFEDLFSFALALARDKEILPYLSLPLLLEAVKQKRGVPVDVTKRRLR